MSANRDLWRASRRGDINGVKKAVEAGADVNAIDKDDAEKRAALHYASEGGHLDVVKYLLQLECSIDIRDKDNWTPLHWAARMGHLAVAKLLLTEGCEKDIKNRWGMTPLHYASREGHVEVVELLIEKGCNKEATDNNGCTPLHRAARYGRVKVVQVLVEKGSKKEAQDAYGHTPLHLAAIEGETAIVKYLLEAKCNPNSTSKEGDTPLTVADNPDIVRELIQHGASLKHAFSRLFPGATGSNPPEPAVNVYIIGDSGAGKSTLTAALREECSAGALSRLARRFANKKVTGVEQKTAGVVPHGIESEKFGRVQVYDFAGQKEFYSSHDTLLSNTLTSSSAAVFIVVADLTMKDQDLCKNIKQWLNFSGQRCKGESHVIIIGSHVDQLQTDEVRGKTELIASVKSTHANLCIAGRVLMDCQFATTKPMSELVKVLSVSCEQLRTKEEINYRSHCFLVYLLQEFPTMPAVQLSVVEQAIRREGGQKLFFLPDSLEHLLTACQDLKVRGHLLILENKEDSRLSWIILDQATLLSQVTGTIFAPVDFKQHNNLASSTGVVPLSRITECFDRLAIKAEVIVRLLRHLEYCQEIVDPEVITSLEADTSASIGEQLYYFPALVSIVAPQEAWVASEEYSYHSGWVLSCRADHFLTTRFLQVLLLRLAFAFALAPHSEEVDASHPALQRKCKVWKNGIYWGTRSGVEALVEITDVRVLLLTRCLKGKEVASVFLRSSVLSKVRQAKNELLPQTTASECFLQSVVATQHPISESSDASAIPVADIAQTIAQREACAVAKDSKPVDVGSLLHFEPYAHLPQEVLVDVVDESEPHQSDRISDSFIQRLAACPLDTQSKLLAAMCVSCKRVSPSSDLVTALKVWRGEKEGSYKGLRTTLDHFSIFAGRSPPEISGVQLPSAEAVPTGHDGEVMTEDATGCLTMDDFRTVRKALWDVRYKWWTIGVELGLRLADLENIEAKHGKEFAACLADMVALWLTPAGPVATWAVLVSALQDRTVGEEGVAEDIAMEYLRD